MKLIDKYLLREYLVPLLYCVCGFSLLYIVVSLFERVADFINAGATAKDVLLFHLHFLAAYMDSGNLSFLTTVLPASVLAGALYSLCRLSRQNELTAMRASGVSLHRLMCPFMAVGLACSIAATAVQELVAPQSSRWVDEFIVRLKGGGTDSDIASGIKYRHHNADGWWSVGWLNTGNPSVLHDVKISVEKGGTCREEIYADKAEWKDGTWWFHGASRQKFLPDGNLDGLPSAKQETPEPMAGLSATPNDFVIAADPDKWERYSSSWTVLRHFSEYREKDPHFMTERLVDAHTRISMPWACLVVILLAIPVGAQGGRQGAFAGVLQAAVLFLAFYISMHMGAILGKRAILAPWLAAWFPHMVFLAIGGTMTSRMR